MNFLKFTFHSYNLKKITKRRKRKNKHRVRRFSSSSEEREGRGLRGLSGPGGAGHGGNRAPSRLSIPVLIPTRDICSGSRGEDRKTPPSESGCTRDADTMIARGGGRLGSSVAGSVWGGPPRRVQAPQDKGTAACVPWRRRPGQGRGAGQLARGRSVRSRAAKPGPCPSRRSACACRHVALPEAHCR